MSNKFENVPVEYDTTIYASIEAPFGEYSVLHQTWRWDGVDAESLIFSTGDIKHLTKDDLIEEVRHSPFIKPESRNKGITFKQNEDFTYVNFNFETSN